MDFTYEGYREVLGRLRQAGYRHGFFGQAAQGKTLYLRHDVDADLYGVPALAAAEEAAGYRSTWFFLPGCPLYNLLSPEALAIVRKLAQKGHQCALHIDAAPFSEQAALQREIETQYAFWAGHLPLVKVVSFHRPSPTLFNDVTIPGFVNTYERRYFSDITYVSDSNRRLFWNETRLDDGIAAGRDIHLVTHPLWWHSTAMDAAQTGEAFIRSKALEARRGLAGTAKLYHELYAADTSQAE